MPGKSTFYLTGGVLAASILLGGGTRSGFVGDVVLQLISVLLLWAALSRLIISRSAAYLKWPLGFAAAVALLPTVQLIPLPTALWSLLPGREVISETYKLIEQSQPLLPLTMSPSATWLSGLSLIPPMSLFLGCLTLDYRQRRIMSVIVVVLGVISVLLGLLQLAQGPDSVLRFFAITNNTDAVGFFANRNHFAALLYSAMIFAAVWLSNSVMALGLQPRRRAIESKALLSFAVCLIAFVSLIVAQLMARSRAGLGLSMVGLIAALFLGLSDQRATSSSRGSAKIAIAATVVAIIFSLQFALYRILERFGPDPLADARIPFARNTITAAKAYMPFGSGLGTFVPVYQMFEQPSDVLQSYANHAHNDLLEVWLETGVIGLVLLGVFLVWYAHKTFSIWRGKAFAEAGDFDRGLAKAASIVLALLLAHSLVDYPLRTSAMMAIAAIASALMIAPSPKIDTTRTIPEGPSGRGRSRQSTASEPKFEQAPDDATPSEVPLSPRPREPWGDSVQWPEAWQKRSPKKE